MSNYAEDPASCRVDFFKPSGKWYTTEAVLFPHHTWNLHPADALRSACELALNNRLNGMIAVCLAPYVQAPFPVAIVIGGTNGHLREDLTHGLHD